MKRALLLLALGLSLMACSHLEIAQDSEQIISDEICFTAYYPDLETKTERQGRDSNGNYPVYWCPGDAVSLFFNQGDHGGNRFVAQNTEVAATAEFKGSITAFTGGSESTGGEFWFWGVYPYSEDNSCDGSSVTLTLPAQQTAKAGSFANGLFPTMAKSQGLSLGFYNICGGFKFTVSRDDIKAVKFRGNANEDIAGKAKIVWDSNGYPAVSEHLVGYKEVTVTAPNNGTFVPGVEYFIVFYPEYLSEGFTLTFITSASKQGSFSYTQSRQLRRGYFVDGPSLDTYVTAWTDAEDPSGQGPNMAGGGTKSGLYLGIIGFNDELYKMDIERLNANSKTRFDAFIDGLTTKNGTLLYYSVDQSLRTLRQAQYPDDLFDVSLVTFTDGLDMGSAMMMDNYTTDDECLESLHNQLSFSSFSGIPLTPYSIGLMGNDVKTSQQKEMFRKNLKKLAYPENNAYEVNDMSSVNARFQEIADKISQTTSTTKYNLELTIPGKAGGTVWRFTLDGATSAESSTMYIEGTFNLSTKALTNVTYHGMTCSSGSTVQGVVKGIHITYTFSDIVPDGEKTLSKDKVWTWYYVQSSSDFWQGNTEFSQDEDVNIIVIHTKQSVVVLLNLDCSTSLDNQFTTLKNYAKSFVATLYNASSDPNVIEEISLDKSSMDLRIGQSQMLQATISPSTASGNTLVWSSAIPSVATVNQSGKVTAVSEGTTIISVSTEDGNEMATCAVSVSEYIPSSTPKDLTLAVSLPTGGRYFLQKDDLQYVNLDNYVVEGLYVVGLSAFIVALEDASSNSVCYETANAHFNLPDGDQGMAISARFTDINNALVSFGGKGLSGNYYWTTEQGYTTDYHKCINGSGGKLVESVNTNRESIREVISLSHDSPWTPTLPKTGLFLSVSNGNSRLLLSSKYNIPDGYSPEGLAISSKNTHIIISLSDASSNSMTYAAASALYGSSMPTPNQAKLISARFTEINNALVSFGGKRLGGNYYWTTGQGSTTSRQKCINGSGGALLDIDKTDKNYVRLIVDNNW